MTRPKITLTISGIGIIVHHLEGASFGDILTSEGKIQVFVEQRFVLLMDHIQKISCVPVKIGGVSIWNK